MNWKGKLKLVLIGLVVILFMIFYIPRAYRGEVEGVVIDKERITYKRDNELRSKYLIYTDTEVFQNVDDWFYFKFNSSDFYGRIEEGKKYRFVVTGWRINIFSKYRNIIAVDRVVELNTEGEESVDDSLDQETKQKEEETIDDSKPIEI